MKTVLVFDDEILNTFNSFKREIEPVEIDSHDDLKVSMMYWMKIIDWRRKENKFIRYMFNRKRRIQKKWDKIFNNRTKEVTIYPWIISWLTV